MTQVTRLTLDEEGALNRRRMHLREISGDLDSPLETVGQDLRAARLARGDDLVVASKALKIRKEHLEALEEDRLEGLPGRAYAVGFVRSYANYLGLDPVLYVDRFKAEIAGRNDVATPQVVVIDEDEHKKLPQGLWIAAVVVLLFVVYGAFKLMETADDALKVGDSSPTEEAALPTPKAPVRKPVPAPVPVQASPEQASVAPPTLGLVPTQNPATVEGGRTVLGDANAQAARPSLPEGRVLGAHNADARVVVRALEPVRVMVESPVGRWYINRSLQPGDVYKVPNVVGLKLTVSNASAVEIDLDGQRVGRVGTTTDPVEAMALDPQAIMDRFGRIRGIR